MGIYIILGILILFIITFTITVIKESKELDKLEKYTFKIAKVSDNLGNSYFKIVGKFNNENFLELEKLRVFRTNYARRLSNKNFESASQSFLSIEVAERELNYFLVHIGQVEYKKDIQIIDSY